MTAEIGGNQNAINAMLEETERMRVRLEKLEKRMKPIPEFLYHVTTRENAAQILREGLDPSKLYFEDRHVASLSDDIDFALGVAEETQHTNRNNLVVLKVDTQYLTPSRVENYLRSEDPGEENALGASAIHEVHYDATIPPEAITVIKER